MNKCPCLALNHPTGWNEVGIPKFHGAGECDEPVSTSGYTVCFTCRYATSPAETRQWDKDTDEAELEFVRPINPDPVTVFAKAQK